MIIMKSIKLLKILTLFMVLALISFSCEKIENDNGGGDVVANDYNGTYMGFAYEGATKIVCWKMEITNGVVSGVGSSRTDNGVITGTINAQGQLIATIVVEAQHNLSIAATISGNTLTGTWSDSVENDNGTLSGNKVILANVSQYNGTYSGFAYDGTQRVGSWKISVNNGFITAVNTLEPDDGSVNGIVDAQGQIIAVTFGGDEETIQISASISGNTISGTWTNDFSGDSGTMSGTKETGTDVSVFNGTYLGFGYSGSIMVVCWKMEITNGVISGIGVSGGDSGSISGTVDADGQVVYIATMSGVGAVQINGTGTISGNVLTGTWADSEDNGNMSGNKVNAADVLQYNGIYIGFAYVGTQRVGSWKINIDNGFISPIATSESDDGMLSGIVNAQGEVTAITWGGDEETIQVSATISGNNISGTWTDPVSSDTGTISGQKQ